ncbi:MAG: hypothetical protein ACP5U0_08910 [Caldisphaera sp.]
MSILVKTVFGDMTFCDNTDKYQLYKRLPGIIDLKESKNEIKLPGKFKKLLKLVKTSGDEITVKKAYLEYIGQKKGLYILHSAAIYKGEYAVLLIGDNFAGKTQAVTNLKGSYKIIADDHIIVKKYTGGIFTAGANRIGKKRGVERYIDFGSDSLAKKKIISAVYIKIIDSEVKDNKFFKIDSNDLAYIVWIQISSAITSIGKYLGNMDIPLPSFDNESLARKRLQFSKNFRSIPFYLYEGSVSGLKVHIDNLLR